MADNNDHAAAGKSYRVVYHCGVRGSESEHRAIDCMFIRERRVIKSIQIKTTSTSTLQRLQTQ